MASGPSLLLLLLPVAVGASLPASCLEGDGACLGSGRSLLQSNKKLSVDRLDHLTMLLQDKDSLLSSGLGSDELAEQFQARAEVAVQNGQQLTPLEQTTMKAVNDSLERMIPELLKGHAVDQAELDTGVQSIKNCNKNFNDDSQAASDAKRGVEATQQDHKYCRGNQSVLKAKSVKASTELHDFWGALAWPKKSADPSPTVFTDVETWVASNKKTFLQKYSEHESAQAALKNKTSICNEAQKLLESGFCQWFGRATAASKSYGRCWSQSGSTWATMREEALISAESRKHMYIHARKVQCYMTVMFEAVSNVSKAGEMFQLCHALSLDTSKFNLTNTIAEPEKNVSDELGPMDSKPGDESWKQSVYAGLTGVAKVTPCAVSHFCSQNEKVRSHRCEACEPGKANQPGDDALGPNTSCTSIICRLDEHVASNACKSCAAGTKNNAGDDASGADTSCSPVLCQAGQRVQNNSCHSCPAGTKNEVGGHDASGADTKCDAISCAEDHYVESNACHTCPPGKTNAAGDDATKGNTSCNATLCKANQKVVSNKCKGCPPGKFNAAGDEASGADTLCKATKCTSNQHVVNNACVACPDGTSRPADDDASGGDTTCSPILCPANHHVESKACKPCPVGQTNEAGDDASGVDTACKAAFTVSGASGRINWGDGSSATPLNGNFTQSGYVNNKPSYTNSAGAVIKWESGNDWGVNHLGTPGTHKWTAGVNWHHRYYNQASTPTPPTHGWVARQGYASGSIILSYQACDFTAAAVLNNKRCPLELWTQHPITREEAVLRCRNDPRCQGLMWYNNDGGDGRTASQGWYQGCGGIVGSASSNYDWDTILLPTSCQATTRTR
eukprot:TRINITY_DN13705_c0_g1_i1.p1 TRINITY_DN13705_c0_g1~~TRINITY_DN13705_c0_g1_i1.p1  ORF type:complete len:847 (+),score=135.52 TRINITY_DN13705_c0_g1_i1:77-2617(+)